MVANRLVVVCEQLLAQRRRLYAIFPGFCTGPLYAGYHARKTCRRVEPNRFWICPRPSCNIDRSPARSLATGDTHEASAIRLHLIDTASVRGHGGWASAAFGRGAGRV